MIFLYEDNQDENNPAADPPPENLVNCPACGADNTQTEAMGVLGRLVWFRCPACGIDFSITREK
jgi:predicted RNA-binding Zn-ribbon protein involved in translation (DUF1610 family)